MAKDPDDTGELPEESSALFSPVQQSADGIKHLFTDIKQYLGISYRFGGQTPAGFDCSGFVRYMFGKVFDMKLPRSSREMSSIGSKVARSELLPGDLVFFQTKGNRINHVGIFLGNDTFVHSSLSKGITKDKLNEKYYDKRFAGGVRVLNIAPDDMQPVYEKILEEQLDNTEPS
jgi:cell wall-associated NlpC family hydrolase